MCVCVGVCARMFVSLVINPQQMTVSMLLCIGVCVCVLRLSGGRAGVVKMMVSIVKSLEALSRDGVPGA